MVFGAVKSWAWPALNRRGGGLSAPPGPPDPDRFLLGLPISFRWNANGAVFDGSGTTSIPNQVAAAVDVLTPTGLLPLPLPSSSFNGQRSISFTGSSRVGSSLAPVVFSGLHNGTGMTILEVFLSGNNGGTRVLSFTGNPEIGSSPGYYDIVAGGRRYFQVVSTAGDVIGVNVTPSVVGDATYTEVSYASAASPKFTARNRGALIASSNVEAFPPYAGAPAFTFRKGASGIGFIGEWVETMILWAPLTPTQRVDNIAPYMLEKYGIPPL